METRNAGAPGSGFSPASQAPQPETASKVEDFIDIFASPAQVFARREKSGFGVHLLIVTIVAALFAFANRGVMSQIFDAEFARRGAAMMAKNPRLTQEMLDNQKGMQEGIATFFGYVGTPVFILFMGLLVWLAARVFSARISYGQAALITTLAWVPRLIGSLVMTIQVALTDTSNVTSVYALSASPARFLDQASVGAKLYALAGNFDVFALWSAVLIAIGITVIGKVPRVRGYLASAALFLVTVLLAVVAA